MRKKELLQRGRRWMARFLVICMAAGTFAVLPPTEEADAASLPNPVLKWDFEGANNSTVPDISGNNNVGTVVDATIVSDSERGGKVADFNGTSAYIAGTAGKYTKTTVAFWAKSRADAPTTGKYHSYVSGDGWAAEGTAQLIRNNRYLSWSISGTTAADGISKSDQPIMPNTNYTADEKDKWVHYAVVYDKEASKVIGYMNGAQVSDLSYTTAVDVDLSSFAAGAWKNKTGAYERFANMQMDDLVIYNGALSADQVQLLMRGGTEPAPAEPELVLKWDFEGANNSTVPDVSGNGHTGTVVNATIASDGERGSKVADFNGTSAYIAGTAGKYTKTTVAFWAKSRADAPTTGKYHSYVSGDGWAAEGTAQLIRNDKYLSWSLSGSNARDQSIMPNTNYTTDEKDKWVHYAVVYDKEASKVIGYMNGAQVSDLSYTTAVDADLSSFAAGAWKNKTGSYERFANMQMDDLVIYNGALSADQVQLLMRGGTEPAPAEPELVLKWDFEGANNSTVPDISGNNNVGTVVDATIVSDSERGGKVADFNGTSAYIAGTAGKYTKTTVAFWAKSRADAPTTGQYHSYVSGDGWTAEGTAQIIRNNKNLGWFILGATASDQPIMPNTNYTTDEKDKWVHYAVVYDKEAGRVVGYMNGAQVSDSSYTTAVDADLSSFAAGAWKNKTGAYERFANMQMDDLVIYNGALSAEAVKKLYEENGGGGDEKITTDSAIMVDTGAAENVNHILTMIAGKNGYGAANTVIKSERTVTDGKKPVYKIDSTTGCELYYSSLLDAYLGVVPTTGISDDTAKENIEEKDGTISNIKYGIVGDSRQNRSVTGFPDLLYFDKTVLLGQTVPESDIERVLAMDVNGDFKLTVNDLVAIIQNYVYGTDFSVVQ